tara:strand:+ start:377 stop:793 length:417 start_codon:yes stop_codon:yes gene_type:complete
MTTPIRLAVTVILCTAVGCFTTPEDAKDPEPVAPAAIEVGDPDCSNIDARCAATCPSISTWDCIGYYASCAAGDDDGCCWASLCGSNASCMLHCESNCECTGTNPSPPDPPHPDLELTVVTTKSAQQALKEMGCHGEF